MPFRFRFPLPALRTGLLGRLVIAFGLVVLFVVIANKAVTNGGTILRISERRVVAPATAPRVAAPVPKQIEPPAPQPHWAGGLACIAGFLSALGTFEHAVERRAVEGTRHADDVTRALTALKGQATLVEREFADIDLAHESASHAATDARRLMEGARILIAQADARHQANASYWQAIDVLDTEIKSALDNTWKILGRVIARESLLEMNRRADDIRRLSSRLLLDGSLDAQGYDDLVREQNALAAQLDALARREGNSRSNTWVTRAQEALKTAIQARVELARIDGVSRNARETMERSHASLDKSVRALTETIEALGESSRTMPQAGRAEQGIRDPAPTPPASGPMRVTGDSTSPVTRTYETSLSGSSNVTWLRWASGRVVTRGRRRVVFGKERRPQPARGLRAVPARSRLAQIPHRAGLAARGGARRVRAALPAGSQPGAARYVSRRSAPALAPAGWPVRVTQRVPDRGGGVRADHDDQRLGDARGDRAGSGVASRRVAERAGGDQRVRASAARPAFR